MAGSPRCSLAGSQRRQDVAVAAMLIARVAACLLLAISLVESGHQQHCSTQKCRSQQVTTLHTRNHSNNRRFITLPPPACKRRWSPSSLPSDEAQAAPSERQPTRSVVKAGRARGRVVRQEWWMAQHARWRGCRASRRRGSHSRACSSSQRHPLPQMTRTKTCALCAWMLCPTSRCASVGMRCVWSVSETCASDTA